MTGSDEPGDGEDETVDLDAPQPPTTATDTVQDPVDWEAQSESGAELDGELNEVRPPSTATEPVQDPPAGACAGRGEDVSDDDEDGSGVEGGEA